MFELCHRAHTAHSSSYKHLNWNARLPDEKELGTELKADTDLWFRAQTSLLYQLPSTVLVETSVADDQTGKGFMLASMRTSGDPNSSRRLLTERESEERPDETVRKETITEKSLPAGVLRRMELSTAGFFEFLFSNRWENGCVLRVLPGRLLENLLHGLTQLEGYHEVISCVTMAYTYKSSIQPCIKTTEKETTFSKSSDLTKDKYVLIELDYFCPQGPLPAMKSKSHWTAEAHPERSLSKSSSHSFSLSQSGPPTSSTDVVSSAESPSLTTITQSSPKHSVSGSQHSFSKTSIPGKTQEGISTVPPWSSFSQSGAVIDSDSSARDILSKGKTSPESVAFSCANTMNGGLRNANDSVSNKITQRQSSFSAGMPSVPKTTAESKPFALPRSIDKTTGHRAASPSHGEAIKAYTGSEKSTASSADYWSQPVIKDGGDNKDVTLHPHVCHTDNSQSSHGDVTSSRYRCNIRGHTKPPPHGNCQMAYHMLRESFSVRQKRQHSGYPSIHLPPLRPEDDKPYMWADRWQDDAHLGPKLESDNSELICSEPFLETYTSDSSSSDTALQDAYDLFAKQRNAIKAANRSMHKREISKDKIWPGLTKSMPESSFDEDEESECRNAWNLDAERMIQLQRDVETIQSEFFVDSPMVQKGSDKKIRIQTEAGSRRQSVKLSFSARQHGKSNRDESESDPSTDSDHMKTKVAPRTQKQMTTKALLSEQSLKKPETATSRLLWRNGAPLKMMKTWKKSPGFDEFYYYLEGMDETETQFLLEVQKQPLEPLEQTSEVFQSHTNNTESASRDVNLTMGQDGSTQFNTKKAIKPKKNRIGLRKKKPTPKRDSKKLQRSFSDIRGKSKRKTKKAAFRKGMTLITLPISGQPFYSKESDTQDEIRDVEQCPHDKASLSEDGRETSINLLHPKKRSLQCSVQSQSQNPFTTHPYSYRQRNTQGKGKEKHMFYCALSDSFPLTKKQETVIKDAGLVISDTDPWHIYAPIAHLGKSVCDTADLRNDVLQCREKMYRIIEGGKLILQLNKSRVWSLVRQIPSERRQTRLVSDATKKEMGASSGNPPPCEKDMALETTRAGTASDKSQAAIHSKDRIQSRTIEHQQDSRRISFTESVHETTKEKLKSTPECARAKIYTDKDSTMTVEKMMRTTADLSETKDSPNMSQLFVDDESIPNNTKEKELFKLMKVNDQFDIGKLKSTYSFERMFSHRIREVPRYWQRIAKYQHPDTKKKTSKDKLKKKSKLFTDLQTTALEKQEDPEYWQREQNGPSLVKTCDAEITISELLGHLLLALKLFVVRKERVTSIDSVQSKVSMTFSRRPDQAAEMDITTILGDAAGNRRLVRALCQTLVMQ